MSLFQPLVKGRKSALLLILSGAAFAEISWFVITNSENESGAGAIPGVCERTWTRSKGNRIADLGWTLLSSGIDWSSNELPKKMSFS